MAFQARRVSLKQAAPASTSTVLAPTEGAITLTGQVASITLILAVVVGSVVIGGNAPSLTQQIAGVSGSVVIGGNAPTVTQAVILSPAEGAIVIGGNAPSLTKIFAPSSGNVVISGNVPATTLQLQATEGSVVISGNAPSIPGNTFLSPTEGNTSIDGFVPDVVVISGQDNRPRGFYGVSYRRIKKPETLDPAIEIAELVRAQIEGRRLKVEVAVESVSPTEEEVKIQVVGVSKRDLDAIVAIIIASEA